MICCPQSTHCLSQELREAFDIRKQRDGLVQKCSAEVISALRKMLLLTPRKVQAILEFLQRDPVGHSSSLMHGYSLQNILIGFLWDSLKHLKRRQLNPKLLELNQSETVEEIYNALCLLNLEVENQTGEVRLLFGEVLDACWAEQSPLKEERLLSCLLRRESHVLLSLFGSVFLEKTREKLQGPKSPSKGLFCK